MSNQTNNLPNNPNIEVIKTKTTGLFTNYIYKAIPLAFDESMSYYETLCGLLSYLKNTVIPALNNNADAVAELQNLYILLKSYVDDYFKNLDVQEEINNKLDNMAMNGVFNQYFAPILQEVENVKTNYRNKDVPITMGDLAQDVKEALTGGSTAVVGINSVNTDNIVDKAVTFRKTANNLLLSQDLKFSPETYNAEKFIYDVPVSHLIISNGVAVGTNDTDITFRNYIIPSGNMLFIPVYSDPKAIRYNIIRFTLGEKPEGITTFTSSMFELGSLNSNTGKPIVNDLYIRTKNYLTPNQRYYADNHTFRMWIYKYNKDDNTYIERTEITDFTTDDEFNYKLVLSDGGIITQDYLNYFIQQVNTTFIASGENFVTGSHDINEVPYNPQYIYKLRFNLGNLSPIPNLPIPGTDYNDYIIIADNVKLKSNTLINKNLSVIGDSFSAYRGIIPSPNAPYYTGSNAGVSSVNDMWWQHLVNDYGCNRIVIQAWSGSSVSNIGASSSNVPMSDVSRCQALDNSGLNPEIIVIMGGTNDFSHANPNIGTYNGTQTFPTTNNDFRSAYALMLQRIREKYPDADIFCCSIPTFVRVPENKYVPQRNGEPETIVNYSNAIKEIASLMRCQYIDLNECGFTPTNYYPTYCVDSSTRPTHPNALGQKIIADVIAKNIIEFYETKPNI